ncbi:MAG: DUF6089 family protein [Saprospiraceae bacterium]|nr:DUF6089 family protein [Saprospiraceae bacterium]MDW8230618.1 DUF6089 family protein [Saprospiraceae bacterium]
MHTRAFLLSILILLAGAPLIQAQRGLIPRFWEAGIGLYTTNYSGDLAPDHISFANTRYSGGLYARYHWNPNIQLRGSIQYLRLSGDDRHHPPNAGRSFRFTSNLLEFSGFLEIALANIAYEPPTGSQTYYFAPYVFAGAGVALYSPKVTYYGPERDRPLFEREPIPEGGRARQTNVVFPFGAGVRLIASDFVAISAEACARPAPSDLIDGVSRNGNPERKDWYYTAGITVSYFLNGPWYMKN